MRKNDLHPLLQASGIPVPEHSGCHAVIPSLVPTSVDVPACYPLFALAKRELTALAEVLAKDRERARAATGHAESPGSRGLQPDRFTLLNVLRLR